MAMPGVSYTGLRGAGLGWPPCFPACRAAVRSIRTPPRRAVRAGGPHRRFRSPAVHRSVIRLPPSQESLQPRRTVMSRTGGPNPPRPARPRERTGAAVRRKLCARRDWNQRTQPFIFSQLHILAEPFAEWPESPPPTRQEETARYAFTRRGRATFAKGTSLCASRVKRFVIERFTPRFLIDLTPVGEGVTAGPRDAVDSILKIGGLGNRAKPRGNVQERQARKDQGDANTEGGLAS